MQIEVYKEGVAGSTRMMGERQFKEMRKDGWVEVPNVGGEKLINKEVVTEKIVTETVEEVTENIETETELKGGQSLDVSANDAVAVIRSLQGQPEKIDTYTLGDERQLVTKAISKFSK